MEKRVEYADGIASTSNAGNHCSGQSAFLFEYLLSSLLSDDALEVPHHRWIRVWSNNRSEEVVSVFDVRHPVSERFVDGVFQSLRAGVYRMDLRAQHLHPVHVKALTLHVRGSHVDLRLQTQGRASHGRGYAVLSSSRFSNDSPFPHTFC